jgi:hypothetical protein
MSLHDVASRPSGYPARKDARALAVEAVLAAGYEGRGRGGRPAWRGARLATG